MPDREKSLGRIAWEAGTVEMERLGHSIRPQEWPSLPDELRGYYEAMARAVAAQVLDENRAHLLARHGRACAYFDPDLECPD